MPDLVLDLRFLKYAILAAEHGSFRRTAAALDVPQSTVSRRISLLERRVGIQIFERSHSGARPTAAGERFLKEAEIGAEQLRQAVHVLGLVQRGQAGELRIGLMASLASGFLAELLAIYRSRFPAIELNLEEATSQVSASAILSGRLDAAFVPGDPKLPGIRSVRIGDEKIFVAVSCNHEVAEQAAVTWDDLGHETFLVMADVAGPEIEAYLVRQLSRSGFHPRISIQRVGRENLLNMVAHTFGITLTTSSTLGIPYPGIRFVPIVSSEDTISSSIIWSQTNQNPALARLVELSIQLADRMSREAQVQQKARTTAHQDVKCRTDDGVS